MVDVFISYSRADQAKVAVLAREIAAAGYEVWWDKDLPPHLSYGDVITAKITEAKAAVVVWSETAAASEWVRAEADVARNQKKLIQVASDGVIPPLPFNQIQCASLSGWRGEPDHPGWSKVKQSLAALCRPDEEAAPAPAKPQPAMKRPNPAAPPPRKPRAPTAPPPAGKNSNANVLIIGGLGSLLAVGLLIWMAVVGSAGGGNGSVQNSPDQPVANAGVVMAKYNAEMAVVDQNEEMTGETQTLSINEPLVFSRYEDGYALVRRSNGTLGWVESGAVQDNAAPAAQ
jgi:hypothetical protein